MTYSTFFYTNKNKKLMAGNTMAAPKLVKFVEKVGCSGSCEYEMQINNGLPLPCQEWTNEESAMLRERMLRDNELLMSGFVRRLERSDLGNSNKYRSYGIDVGDVRTQDSGVGPINSCNLTFNNVTFTDFEKTFYVVTTELNTRMCTRQFIGKRQGQLIGDKLSNFDVVEEFANTSLADIIIAKTIEKFQDFLPSFMILATAEGSGRNLHGDDGILAKAYYAERGQYFHTVQYDMSEVTTGAPNTFINAIVGGSRYDKVPSAFATPDLYLLNFVEWLNTRKERRNFMFDVTLDASTDTLVVASQFVTREVDLIVILNEGDFIDWGCDTAVAANRLEYLQLQGRMLINDTPMSFQYENIDNTNFFDKFKAYKKEYMIYLHNNGFNDVSINDVLIGIDPLLMLEREDYILSQKLIGNFNADSINEVGFGFGQFKPLNLLNNTGLFFMTTRGNILQLSDGDNYEANMNNIRIRESKCEGKVNEIEIIAGVPPVGSDVEAWGVFASNITDSWFVLDNKLADRQPYKHTMENLECYDDNAKGSCVTQSGCNIASNVEVEAVYDSNADTTNITVVVNATLNTAGTLVYDLAYALSDGTAASGISTDSFIITLPGDRTNVGLRISVDGKIEGTTTLDGGTCEGYVVFTEQIGEDPVIEYCTHTVTNNPQGIEDDIGADLQLQFNINGAPQVISFVNAFLDYSNNAFGTPYDSIALEIEAILPGTIVSLTGNITPLPTITVLVISNVPSYVTDIELFSLGTGNGTGTLATSC